MFLLKINGLNGIKMDVTLAMMSAQNRNTNINK